MSEQPTPKPPFATLGTHLKYLREQSCQTLGEVSGAVEIDEYMLERIESGAERPSEDILMLLISHFGMRDQEAVRLWELAGYEDRGEQGRAAELLETSGKPVLLLAMDMRTLYSDHLDVQWNQAGLTLEFGQKGAKDQAIPVSRVGMSYDQAELMVKVLQQAILRGRYHTGPKQLPEPNNEM